MRILDKYIFKELIGPFIFGIAAFSFILAGSTVLFQLVGEAVKYGIPISQTMQIFFYKFPSVMVFTFPMSMLLATIIAMSRLSSDKEIIAFRAGGISIYRIIIPIIITGLIVSLATIWFNESIVPRASYSAETLLHNLTNSDKTSIKKNINLTEYDEDKRPLRIINVQEIDGTLLKGINLAEYEAGKLVRLIQAETGYWRKSGGWEFFTGTMHNFGKNQHTITIMDFKKEYIQININPLELTKREKSVEEMNTRELASRIDFKRRTGQDPTSDLVKFHMKLAIPFASLIFAILGASVGLKPHRSSSSIGVGISLIIILIYYILISFSMGLGLSEIFNPAFAAWMPNIIIGAAALILLNKVAN